MVVSQKKIDLKTSFESTQLLELANNKDEYLIGFSDCAYLN